MANIIQAEFFQVGGGKKQETLRDLIAECIDRRSAGSPIKTVVRFYDDDRGSITRNVALYKELDVLHEELVRRTLASRGFWRWLFDISARQVARTRGRAKKVHMHLVLKRLWEIERDPQSIAVEERDHHFRYVRWDEKHELLEAAGKGTSLWLFVFEPNHLLADSNTLAADAM